MVVPALWRLNLNDNPFEIKIKKNRNNITSFEVLDFGVYGLEDEGHLV